MTKPTLYEPQLNDPEVLALCDHKQVTPGMKVSLITTALVNAYPSGYLTTGTPEMRPVKTEAGTIMKVHYEVCYQTLLGPQLTGWFEEEAIIPDFADAPDGLPESDQP